ncbi:neutral zinc metallopeptidase [Dongia sp.]|uniref:KPN_02809 family neutral zinc metallopeptidase n=1 Tax=Dongia sp. TaxID=1977262 RepID=UPI003753AF46
MLWRGGRRSTNVEDRRGSGGFGGGFGGGGGGIKVGGLGLVVILLVGWFFGVDPSALLSQIEGGSVGGYEQPANTTPIPQDDEGAQFVQVVLADTEDTWSEIFQQSNATYQPPRLVLFTGRTATACGTGAAAMGPFYCPGDAKVYIDLSFYEELKQRFQAPGDFAQAYVIAHEVGHHIQQLIGSTEDIERAFGGGGQSGADSASVRIELQADCFAGVWAYHANQRKIVEPGDVEEALNAATAIGDDKLQEQGQGYVVPDSFTHGTSAQRVRWFKRGMESGDVNACDTLTAKTL